MRFVLDRNDKARVIFDDDQELTLLLTRENGGVAHLRITGETSLVVKPSASNQIRVEHEQEKDIER